MTTPNYSLYLVTDSTPAILGDRDLVDVVDKAIQGGVTIIQYREKKAETVDLIKTASSLHAVTKRHGVPLLINDRLDVAIAVGAEGVHLGQEDMDIGTARRALGKDAIIGVTASSVSEAIKAAHDGADYLGLGTVFSTATKENTKSIVGTTGLRRMLQSLSQLPAGVKKPSTVCIGGINASNVQRVLYQSRPAPPNHQTCALDGVAVVSAIIAAQDPQAAARELQRLLATAPPFTQTSPEAASTARQPLAQLVQAAPALHQSLAQTKPLSHNMTNTVVQNMAANIALAIGASPIMSQNAAEAADLAAIPAAGLVINMGTANADALATYSTAIRAYNAAGRPVLLDPVGGGATALRRDAVRTLLNAGYFSVVKGNEAEIRTVWAQGAGKQALGAAADADEGSQVRQRGVDSGDSSLDDRARAALARDLALRERNTVLMTGATDFLSDGMRTLAVKNGHPFLGEITGSGCSLGTTVLSFVAADGAGKMQDRDTLRAALAGLLVYEIAAERAVETGRVFGPGSFVPAFIDALHLIREESLKGDFAWAQRAKVEEVEL